MAKAPGGDLLENSQVVLEASVELFGAVGNTSLTTQGKFKEEEDTMHVVRFVFPLSEVKCSSVVSTCLWRTKGRSYVLL